MDKRGQFFLVAAIIISGALIGISSVVNYASVSDRESQIYDLGKEIGFEGKQVLDYGVYNGQNTPDLLQGLIRDYSSYISEDQVIFVYGNADSLTGYYFVNRQVGSVGITTGGAEPTRTVINSPRGEQAQVSSQAGRITVRIDGIDYNFDLRAGQNFYFVIARERDEERYVVSG